MNFKKDGYKIIKNWINTRDLYNESISFCELKPGTYDIQAPNSPAYYGEPELFQRLHSNIIPRLQLDTGYKLYKTYFYWRMYYVGSTLTPHTDRPACEISGTLFLGGDDWDIFLKDKTGKTIRVKQKPGDILLYRGCELTHWREKFTGSQHAQIFLHYVDQNGPNSWCKDDIKKTMSEHIGAGGGS